MHGHSNQNVRWSAGKSIRTASAVLSLSLLTACLGDGLFSGSGPASNAGGVSRMQKDVENAVCQGAAEDAVAIMVAEPLVSPADRFFLALAVEESGGAARARGIYAQLMQSGSIDHVYAACGRRILADGSVSNESARRLADISRDLAVHDVNLRPSPALHSGLPSNAPVTTNSAATNSYSGPVMSVGRPASQSPFGQWFLHLASYRSIEQAVKNKNTLETQFPTFSGIIDQWEVNVSGLAVRLGVRVGDRNEATNLCNAVKSNGAYCAVLDTSQE
jgi:hypothetical protein